MHLYNPWNEGKPVKIGRDGQVSSLPHSFKPLVNLLSYRILLRFFDISYDSIFAFRKRLTGFLYNILAMLE